MQSETNPRLLPQGLYKAQNEQETETDTSQTTGQNRQTKAYRLAEMLCFTFEHSINKCLVPGYTLPKVRDTMAFTRPQRSFEAQSEQETKTDTSQTTGQNRQPKAYRFKEVLCVTFEPNINKCMPPGSLFVYSFFLALLIAFFFTPNVILRSMQIASES